jgi:DNA polymerase-3 subunit gamma/tau
MLARLQEICQAEGAKLSDRALRAVVRQSEGGMRDSLSLLDQVFSACGPEAKDEEVFEALGAIDRTLVQDLASALVHRDTQKLLTRVDEAFDRGVKLERLLEELALELRHVFVAKATGAAPRELAESDQHEVMALAKETDAAQLARLFDVVHGSIWDVARAAQPKLAIEMALLKAVHLAPGAAIPELVSRVEKLLAGQPVSAPRAQVGAPGGRSAPGPFRA